MARRGCRVIQLANSSLWGCGEALINDKAAIQNVMQVGL